MGECALMPPANASSAGLTPPAQQLHALPQLCLEPHIYPSPAYLEQGCESRWTDGNMQLNSRWMWTFYLACCTQVSFLTFGWCRISRNICSAIPTYAAGRPDPVRYCLSHGLGCADQILPPSPKPDTERPGKDPPFPKCFAYLPLGRLPTYIPTPARPRIICCPWRTLSLPFHLPLTSMCLWGQPYWYCA